MQRNTSLQSGEFVRRVTRHKQPNPGGSTGTGINNGWRGIPGITAEDAGVSYPLSIAARALSALKYDALSPVPFAAPFLPAQELADRQSCKFTRGISPCDVDSRDLC